MTDIEKALENNPRITGEILGVCHVQAESEQEKRTREEFVALTKPLVEWLRDNYGLNSEIWLDCEYAKIFSVERSAYFPVNWD